VVVESHAKKVLVVQGAALRKSAVVGRQQLLEVMVVLLLRTQRLQHAHAFACGDSGAFRFQCQARQELGCTRMKPGTLRRG
jgi:hypothetical protein